MIMVGILVTKSRTGFITLSMLLLSVAVFSRQYRKYAVIAIMFFGAAMFWSGFEQAGSSMNIFARDFTDRIIFDKEII